MQCFHVWFFTFSLESFGAFCKLWWRFSKFLNFNDFLFLFVKFCNIKGKNYKNSPTNLFRIISNASWHICLYSLSGLLFRNFAFLKVIKLQTHNPFMSDWVRLDDIQYTSQTFRCYFKKCCPHFSFNFSPHYSLWRAESGREWSSAPEWNRVFFWRFYGAKYSLLPQMALGI